MLGSFILDQQMVIGNCEKKIILYVKEIDSYQAKPPLQRHLLTPLNSLWHFYEISLSSALSRLCQDIRYLPCIGFTASLIK